MNDLDLAAADAALEDLHGKTLTEAARSYLLGVLEVDLPEDLDGVWRASFDDDDERHQTEQALEELDSGERETLLRSAMRATVEQRPDTAQLFVDSIEQAGKSLFVIEVAVIAIAATMIMREYYAKGRESETRTVETVHPDDSRTTETHTTKFASSGTLAKLLVKLGIGG